MPGATILRALERVCSSYDGVCVSATDSPPDVSPGTCDRRIAQWASATPPLRLR